MGWKKEELERMVMEDEIEKRNAGRKGYVDWKGRKSNW